MFREQSAQAKWNAERFEIIRAHGPIVDASFVVSMAWDLH